jgi:hypothetical protein
MKVHAFFQNQSLEKSAAFCFSELDELEDASNV